MVTAERGGESSVREFSMSSLVERTGVAAATIRYYLAEHLLPPPRRAASNRFLYDERHVEVIRLIRLLQERRNLSLETIGRLLPDLLPDLTGQPEGGLFHPEMWGQLLAVHFPASPSPSPADLLVDAGLAAFSRHGYSDVSIDDVCRTAVIAKGSFYRYFTSKEELFFAVAAATGRRVAEAIVGLGGGEQVPVDRAVEIVAQSVTQYLAIVLDLCSLAAQRRPGHGRVLRALMSDLYVAVDDLLGRNDVMVASAVDEGHVGVDEVVDLGLMRSIRLASQQRTGVAVLDELRDADKTG
jgi:AcrR family transcriptional regulator/DNA-binding transcriptional MerR regulator